MTGIRLGSVSLAIAFAGCIAACTATSPGLTAVSPSTPAATAAATTGLASTEPPSTDEVAGPPAATLAAEGGDPVIGQLGTFVWAGGGSDSPWLPGAPITAGVGEPLAVAFRPTIDLDSWAARYVPSTASDATGATPLGQGSGTPQFGAPVAGSWTIEVHVVFADDAGNASYFWKLTTR